MSLVPQCNDVAQFLNDNGQGVLGSDLFSNEWGEPDSQILVLNGVGVVEELKELYEEVGVQIMCRGTSTESPTSVYTRAKTISNFLLSQPEHIDINDTCYLGFEPSSSIANLGKDEENRHVVSMNFRTYRNR